MAQGDGEQIDWLDNLVESIQSYHDLILENSGGVQGVHAASLYGACARTFQTIDEQELYPCPFLKAAALFHRIICDHAFVDGNKRTATFTAVAFLVAQSAIPGQRPVPLQVRMLGELAIATADAQGGRLSVGEVANWFRRILDADLKADA